MSKFANKTIMVTGASSGIGEAFVRYTSKKLGEEGQTAKFLLLARNQESLEKIAGDIKSLGMSVEVIILDITDTNAISKVFLSFRTKKTFSIHYLLNNAGLGFSGSLMGMQNEQVINTIDLNVRGALLITKESLRYLVKGSHIVMISSIAGLIPMPNWSVYVASKWAITGFAESLRMELAGKQIKVSSIHPGPVTTSFFSRAGMSIADNLKPIAVSADYLARIIYDSAFTKRGKIVVSLPIQILSKIYRYMPLLYRIISRFLPTSATN